MLWRPPHAYVPGQTQRHTEDLFDPYKVDLNRVPATQLHTTSTWVMSRAFFDEGFFWEAHELLESIWMACQPNTPEKLLVQAFIQQTNASLKVKMGRSNAAARLRKKAAALAQEAFRRGDGCILGIGTADWVDICNRSGDCSCEI